MTRSILATILAILPVASNAADADLVIEVGGALLDHGGIITIYAIPIDQAEWDKLPQETVKINLNDRYAVVQQRYPKGGKYSVFFRQPDDTDDIETFATQLMGAIGADEKGEGPQMTAGFTGAFSSGGQEIRVLPRPERNETGAARALARWGKTEGRDALPPADERSARSLSWILEPTRKEFPLTCTGDARVQACTIEAQHWPLINMRWWQAIAEARLERLQYHAQERCASAGWTASDCHENPGSNEPDYLPK